MKLTRNSSFTLVELLIVIGLLAAILFVAIILINPIQQIGKANDARRKSDLAMLKKSFEEYYNDKGCYPKPNQVCYGTISNLCNANRVITQTCYICGNEAGSPDFSPWVPKLPCDPEHARLKYMYQSEGNKTSFCNDDPLTAGKTCPTWFRIYSDFSNDEDSDSAALGCSDGGCGPGRPPPALPALPYGFDYGVASPNEKPETSTAFACAAEDNSCQICGTSTDCQDPDIAPACIGRPLYNSCRSCCQETGFCNPASCP